jgi:adenylosuccinate synthase
VNGHVIVVDLGYGDAGKGTIVDWLCASARRRADDGDADGDAGDGDGGSRQRPVQAVVRFNGGAQAAHHVLAPDGTPHPFAQFGSGTFTPGTRTFLSRHMLVDPLALVAEAERLARRGVTAPLRLVAIDRNALLTTPYHRAVNQARERARGAGRHGSCGMGIGETAAYALDCPDDAPRAGDVSAPGTLRGKLERLRDKAVGDIAAMAGSVPATLPRAADLVSVYREVAALVTLTGDGYLARLLRAGPVVFEGAQGVLLDEWRGFHPYTTWSTTTFANAETLLAEAGAGASLTGSATRLGVTRTYQTRHGPGPFPTEDPALPGSEQHNRDGRWQGPFRYGHLDAVALAYAREVAGGVDAVALTHLDTAERHAGELRVCRGYRIDGELRGTLIPGPHRDLDYQQDLTTALLRARPVYDGTERLAAQDWPDAVAEILRAPVAVVSSGPGREAKSARPVPAASR